MAANSQEECNLKGELHCVNRAKFDPRTLTSFPGCGVSAPCGNFFGEKTMTKRETPLILVVEDYPDTRTLLSSLLRSKGYMVIEAGDGKEGVRQANRVNPDLILMDLALPELDGVEATRQIRQRQSHSQTPIFAVSAFATSDVQQDALDAGCNEVFTKPLEIEPFLGKIRATLNA